MTFFPGRWPLLWRKQSWGGHSNKGPQQPLLHWSRIVSACWSDHMLRRRSRRKDWIQRWHNWPQVCPVGCGHYIWHYIWLTCQWIIQGGNVSLEKWTWGLETWSDWAPDRLLKPERPPADRGILYFILLALCGVWSDVNVSPCDQQDRKDLFLVWNHKCVLIDVLDGNRKTPRSCHPAWLCGTMWCQVWSGSQTLLAPGDGRLCCVLWTLFLICPLYVKHTLQSLFKIQSDGMLLDKHHNRQVILILLYCILLDRVYGAKLNPFGKFVIPRV